MITQQYVDDLAASMTLPVYRERSWNVWTEEQHKAYKVWLVFAKYKTDVNTV